MAATTLPDARPWMRAHAAVAMIVVGALAAVGAIGGAAAFGGQASVGEGGAEIAEADAGITTTEREVTVVPQIYEPGQSSGWHRHPGVHAVAVLSGTLTVYDDQCRPATFGSGSSYVGGRQLHLARNDIEVAVEMIVTYISPTRAAESTQPGRAPAGC